MLPALPELKHVDNSRVILPNEHVSHWDKSSEPADLRMIPLVWRRPLALPARSQLDAWYLWRKGSNVTDWELDPEDVIAGKIPDLETQFRLRFLVYEAKIDTKTKAHRLRCARLFTSLALKSDGSLWVVPEPDESISVWTDGAFQLYHGRLESPTSS